MGKKKGKDRQGAPSPVTALASAEGTPTPFSIDIQPGSKPLPGSEQMRNPREETGDSSATGRRKKPRGSRGDRSRGSKNISYKPGLQGSAETVVRPNTNPPAPTKESSKKRKRVDSKELSQGPQVSTGKLRKKRKRVMSKERKETLSADSKPGSSREASVAAKPSSPVEPPSYMPILQSQTVPPHLRHPFRSFPSTATFDISQAIHSDPNAEKRPAHEYFEYAQQSPHAYWANADSEQKQHEITQRRKLVVLDLNGALVVRSERTAHYVAQAQRKVFPRPFLNCFLDFLMSPICTKADKPQRKARPERMRPFEVFIWSSAQPKSIGDMVSSTFGTWADTISPHRGTRLRALKRISSEASPERKQGRILGVWSRSDMGLTHEQYFQKSATLKDLDKLYTLFTRDDRFSAPYSRFFYPDPMFFPDPTNTLLIDDSTDKASLQPYNHLPILDFEWKMLKDAAEAVEADEQVHGVLDVLKPADALRLIFGHDALDFYRRSLSVDTGTATESEERTVDGILLAIVGILSEIQDVQSIPAWMAAGGLRPDITHTFTEEIAEQGWEHVVSLDAIRQAPDLARQEMEGRSNRKKRKVDATAMTQDSSSTGDTSGNVAFLSPGTTSNGIPPQIPDHTNHVVQPVLPSHPEYKHWYDSPLHVLYWVRRGLVALEERGVQLQHNMTGIAKRLQEAERERQEMDEVAAARQAASFATASQKGDVAQI